MSSLLAKYTNTVLAEMFTRSAISATVTLGATA
jgi:hypothetical protein